METNGHSVDIKHGSEYCARFKEDADVELYFDNSVKLETKSDGVDITGELQCDTLDVDGNADISGTLFLGGDLDMNDADAVKLGAADDMQIYHDGTHSRIDNNFNDLIIRNQADDRHIYLQTDDGSGGTTTYLQCSGSNGEVTLHHYGTTKLNTSSSGVHVSGNITITGNVDGRDVSADGSKLDGIESGATADQSASEILTAIKTVDGSGSGLDADTLDGFHRTSYLTSYYTSGTSGWQNSSSNYRFSSGGNSGGILMTRQDNSTMVFQLYGDGNNYGFLDGHWAAWDIQKVINGPLKVDAGSGLKTVLLSDSQYIVDKWVNFNQSSVRDQVGISSVSDNGTGSFYVNFSGNMSNTNYAVTTGNSMEDGFLVGMAIDDGYGRGGSKNTSGFSVFTNHDGNSNVDPHTCMCMIMGD